MSKLARLKRKTLLFTYNRILGDRRCKLYDLSKLETSVRQPRSPIIQFYSSVDNIGNYTPVLGIQKLLGQTTDTWCMHDRAIDFDFINRHYKCAIIGGAGLLHRCFDPFWKRFFEACKIPTVIWGVGTCFPDQEDGTGADRAIVSAVAQRCDLVNVRDDLTADYYNLNNAHISPCPTITYLEEFRDAVATQSQLVLYSWHDSLVPAHEREAIKQTVRQFAPRLKHTDNFQYPFLGLTDIIRHYYCPSRVVVTTRLHGAIIAYGLGIPYIGIPRDQKLRAFHKLYGNGVLVDRAEAVQELISEPTFSQSTAIATQSVSEFGQQARQWAAAYC